MAGGRFARALSRVDPTTDSASTAGATPAPTAWLVDASLYVFRAYHSLPPDWHDDEGWPTHAVHGYTHFLLNLLEQVRPSHIAVCFDESLGSSFRHRIYPAYKANRERPDETLLRQFVYCREITRALGLSCLAHAEFEADDLIGSLVEVVRAEGGRSVIVSADKDLSQLVGEHDEQWDFGRDRHRGPAGVEARMGVRPDQVADLLALAGDSIDNIPGVRGIGATTAVKLLRHFDSIDDLYRRLPEVGFLRLRGARTIQAKLAEQREAAMLSRELTRIRRDAPVPQSLAALACRGIDLAAIDDQLQRCGFGPLLRRRVREAAQRARH